MVHGVYLRIFVHQDWHSLWGLFLYRFYRWLEPGPYADDSVPRKVVSRKLLISLGLFYGVLAFNLGVTFRTGEIFMGVAGSFIVVPLTAALLVTPMVRRYVFGGP
jgi:hypothetical protein